MISDKKCPIPKEGWNGAKVNRPGGGRTINFFSYRVEHVDMTSTAPANLKPKLSTMKPNRQTIDLIDELVRSISNNIRSDTSLAWLFFADWLNSAMHIIQDRGRTCLTCSVKYPVAHLKFSKF